MRIIKINISDLEYMNNLRGKLIICNHPCLLDTVIVMAYLQNIQCVVKHSLWHSIFLGGVVRAAGYIRNDLPAKDIMAACKYELALGQNILIFPEGTRTTPGKAIKLQRGLANLALEIKADIQALVIRCHPITLTKQHKWYQIPMRRVVLQLTRGRFFSCDGYDTSRPRSLKVRALTRDIQQYYNRCLKYE